MKPAALLIAGALGLSACGPAEPPPPPPLKFDCALGYDALSQKVAAEPGVQLAPEVSGEPYRYYNAEDGKTSYVVTKKGAPGHPAVLKQTAAAGAVTTTGCPYGSKAGYQELLTYLKDLKAGGGK